MKLANQIIVAVLLLAIRSAYPGNNFPTADDPQTVPPNGCGLGSNQDIYVRPHQYPAQDGQVEPSIFNEGVKRNAYGPGVHTGQLGRLIYDLTA